MASMIIPGQLYGLMNKEDFPETDILYDITRTDIVLKWNEPIRQSDDYPFYFFQGGSYVPVVSESSKRKGDYYYYRIDENQITIYGHQGIFPGGFVYLHIPDELTGKHGSRFAGDQVLLLSPNELTPQSRLEWLNYVERDQASLVIPMTQASELPVGYVIKNKVPLLNRDKSESDFLLYRGESFKIMEEERQYYKILLYLSAGLTKNSMRMDEATEEAPYVQVKEGYLKKEDVALLPLPLNPGSIYAVNHSEDLIAEEAPSGTHLIVLAPLIGKTEVYLPDSLEPAGPEDFYALESVTLWQWLGMLPGSNYWSSYADENGAPVSKLEPGSHTQERLWNEEQYQRYQDARKTYTQFVLSEFEKFMVAEDYRDYKSSIYPQQIQKRIQLQDIWVEWGYNDRNLDPKWFFDRILQRFDFTEDERIRYTKLFHESRTETEQQFNDKLGRFINEYIVDTYTSNRIQQTMDRFAVPRSAPPEGRQELQQMMVTFTKKIREDLWEATDQNHHTVLVRVVHVQAAPALNENRTYVIGAIRQHDEKLKDEVYVVEGDMIRPLDVEDP